MGVRSRFRGLCESLDPTDSGASWAHSFEVPQAELKACSNAGRDSGHKRARLGAGKATDPQGLPRVPDVLPKAVGYRPKALQGLGSGFRGLALFKALASSLQSTAVAIGQAVGILNTSVIQ